MAKRKLDENREGFLTSRPTKKAIRKSSVSKRKAQKLARRVRRAHDKT